MLCSSNIFKGVVRETFQFRYGIQALLLSKSRDSIASLLLFEWAINYKSSTKFRINLMQQELYLLQYGMHRISLNDILP